MQSVEVIKMALQKFKDKSGLSPCVEKSEVFFGNVDADTICSPLKCGGLGVKRLALWNRCFLFKHIWDILTKRNSLGENWIHTNCIRGRNFWIIKNRNEWSLLTQNLLDIRSQCRRHFISIVGNGIMTHAYLVQF